MMILTPVNFNLSFNLEYLWAHFCFSGSAITKCLLILISFSSLSMRYSGGLSGKDGAEIWGLIH